MVLIATITKKTVRHGQPKLWTVTLNMTITDGGVEVINKDYSVEYITGDSVSAKRAEWGKMMQADIEKYNSEQNIFNAPALDGVVTNLASDLVV